MSTTATTRYTTRTLPAGTRLVFAHSIPPQRSMMRPVSNITGFVKPRGGLWTCPAGSYGWRAWCLDEEYRQPHELIEHTLVTARPATVAFIDSVADLDLILTAHGVPNPYSYRNLPKGVIDFEALAREVDGVWLTERGQWDTRWAQPGLYGWDLESVLLFDWIF